MNQLPIFVNLKGRKVILLGEGPAADAKRRLYERAGAEVTDDENTDTVIAVVAVEDRAAAAEASAKLKKRGLLVNVVDRPDLCDFTTPAIVDRDPVLIAIGTGGASAGLAKALRQRLERLVPQSAGALAKALFAARDRIKHIWPDSSDRRHAIDVALEEGSLLDPFSDYRPEILGRWLDSPDGLPTSEIIELALGENDDPDELTIRQARLLSRADRIYADRSIPEAVLNRGRADAERFDLEEFDGGATDGLTVVIRIEN